MAGFSERVRGLGLPTDRVIVIGSGLLDQLNIREAKDIDLVVTPGLFEQLKLDPRFDRAEKFEEEYLTSSDGVCEIWRTWGGKDFNGLMADSENHNGVSYVSLTFLERWKRAKARPKDLQDVERIEEYRQHGK